MLKWHQKWTLSFEFSNLQQTTMKCNSWSQGQGGYSKVKCCWSLGWQLQPYFCTFPCPALVVPFLKYSKLIGQFTWRVSWTLKCYDLWNFERTTIISLPSILALKNLVLSIKYLAHLWCHFHFNLLLNFLAIELEVW